MAMPHAKGMVGTFALQQEDTLSGGQQVETLEPLLDAFSSPMPVPSYGHRFHMNPSRRLHHRSTSCSSKPNCAYKPRTGIEHDSTLFPSMEQFEADGTMNEIAKIVLPNRLDLMDFKHVNC